MSDWCILRMAGPRTLKVVQSLTRAGLTVWTPMAMQRQRRPRSNKYRDVEVAALPTYAFARYDDLAELIAIQHAPVSDHPAFTLFQHRHGFPPVTDAALEGLRDYEVRLAEEWREFCLEEEKAALERRRKQKTRKPRGRRNARRSYVLGQTVTVVDPAFEGLKATVIENFDDGQMIIDLGGMLQIKVEACDLAPFPVGEPKPKQAKAA